MPPPRPTSDSSEKKRDAPLPKPRRSHVRQHSDGMRGVFYANPMPETFARRKRDSAKQMENNPVDFSSMVAQAFEAEASNDSLDDLDVPPLLPTKRNQQNERRPVPSGNQRYSSYTAHLDQSPSIEQDQLQNTPIGPYATPARHQYGTMPFADDFEIEKTMLSPISEKKNSVESVIPKMRPTPIRSMSSMDDSLSMSQTSTDYFFSTDWAARDANAKKDPLDLGKAGNPRMPPRGDWMQRNTSVDTIGTSDFSLPTVSTADGGGVGGAARNDEISSFARLVQESAPEPLPLGPETINSASVRRVPPLPPPHERFTKGAEKKPLHPLLAEKKEPVRAKVRETKVEDQAYPLSKGFPFITWLTNVLDPTPWLLDDMFFDESDITESRALFPEDQGYWSIRGVFRVFFYNPEYPEFTSLQLFIWSIIIGLLMGCYTAAWKILIESCVDFVWVDTPEFLRKIGFFTDLDGSFPMMHYMWMCPTVFSSILSYIFAALPTPIPGQNEWINNVHSKGVQEFDTFWQLFLLATAGMASGLSLGPELPLVLTAGMAGSYFGILTHQSVLHARVLNLVAAGSAVGGFFGFPMAGALFVLEIPHRMGLQYFEALSPAIFGSIVAVLMNRMLVNNDVTGYYKYPFLTSTLPSSIFWHAIIFGMYGAVVGIGYAKGVLKLKGWVHDIFHEHDHGHDHAPAVAEVDEEKGEPDFHAESTPLFGMKKMAKAEHNDHPLAVNKIQMFVKRFTSFGIKHEPYRAAVSGAIAGFLVGITGMFLPHIFFWGEAQLQNLIDKGRTPLPIFGRGDDPTADLTSWGYCLLDSGDPHEVANGFGLECSALIALAKIFVTGLSLGTGIIGGHFWGPLFVGCISSHFFTDLSNIIAKFFNMNPVLGAFPCVAILCTMGATHVVTFRAHTAIMLILTLTISAFNPEDSTTGNVAGDYSAVFPLLVVAVYVSLMISKDQIKFYGMQRSRGDIMALPEVLCEPGKEGAPMIVTYEDYVDHTSQFSGSHGGDNTEATGHETSTGSALEVPPSSIRPVTDRSVQNGDFLQDVFGSATESEAESPPTQKKELTMDEIERQFNEKNKPQQEKSPSPVPFNRSITVDVLTESGDRSDIFSSRLDQLLSAPLEAPLGKVKHKRHQSTSAVDTTARSFSSASSFGSASPKSQRKPGSHRRTKTALSTEFSNATRREEAVEDKRLVPISAYGEITDLNYQPSIMDQARARASSLHRRNQSIPKHRTTHSRAESIDLGAVVMDDLDVNFDDILGKL